MRHIANWFVVGGLVLASACSDPVLEQRVADLEAKQEELEKKIAEIEKAGPAPRVAAAGAAERAPAATPEQEEEAAELLREANELVQDMEYGEAKERLTKLSSAYPTTRAARSSRRLAGELDVIGVSAGDLETDKWYVGKTSMDDGKATLVVFWEVWCPHCRREVPALQATYEKYEPLGLNVAAVTKITKSATEEGVTEFIDEHDLTFPIGKENGALSTRFGVRGIPAAAVVKDGKVVWRGHPARLTDKMFRTWLELPAEG